MVSGSSAVSNSFVSQSGWWCPALRLSPIHLSPHITIHLSPSLAGGVRLFGCLQFICLAIQRFICLPVWLVVSGSSAVPNSFVSPYIDSFVSQSGWWCPALRLSPIHLSPHTTIHLSHSLVGGVRLFGCLQFICLPVWLVVSGSLAVSDSFASPYDDSFVSQSGWWCPALRLSPIHLSPHITIHLSPSLAGGVRLFGCLQFICLPI